jgi:hypothetical protein
MRGMREGYGVEISLSQFGDDSGLLAVFLVSRFRLWDSISGLAFLPLLLWLTDLSSASACPNSWLCDRS